MNPRSLSLAIVGGAAIASFALLRHRGTGLAQECAGRAPDRQRPRL